MKLSGWGNYPRVEVRVLGARGTAETVAVIDREASLIPRGNGRAYGDSALNRNATLSMRPSDRMLAFDAGSGLLACEAGVMLADIIEVLLPRGWFVPVTPGTKFVTLGGMIAADVHGKNHHRAGSICSHIAALPRLRGADVHTIVTDRTLDQSVAAFCALLRAVTLDSR